MAVDGGEVVWPVDLDTSLHHLAAPAPRTPVGEMPEMERRISAAMHVCEVALTLEVAFARQKEVVLDLTTDDMVTTTRGLVSGCAYKGEVFHFMFVGTGEPFKERIE